jgi:hypothetical protein
VCRWCTHASIASTLLLTLKPGASRILKIRIQFENLTQLLHSLPQLCQAIIGSYFCMQPSSCHRRVQHMLTLCRRPSCHALGADCSASAAGCSWAAWPSCRVHAVPLVQRLDLHMQQQATANVFALSNVHQMQQTSFYFNHVLVRAVQVAVAQPFPGHRHTEMSVTGSIAARMHYQQAPSWTTQPPQQQQAPSH